MIKVTIEMWPGGDETKKYELGSMEISNDGSGTVESGNYTARLHAEYTTESGRYGRVKLFNRQKQSVFSLVGAFLKLWGHTSHSPQFMSKD